MGALLASWVAWALLSALFAALTAILMKLGLGDVDPDLATLVRTAVVLLLAGGVVAATRPSLPAGGLGARAVLLLVLSGLATGASWLCYARALQLGPASRVAPLDKLSVVLVAVLGAALLGERLGPQAWAGVGLIAAGAVLVARAG